MFVPSGPAMTERELHAIPVEPPQPGAQQGRGLECFRKHPPAAADKGRLPQRFAPGAQGVGRKRLDRRRKALSRLAIARKKFRQRLAMSEIQSAAAGHQKLAASRRHGVVDGDAGAAPRQHLRRHQAGGTGPDDGDVAQSFTPARLAAWPTYFWVCSKAPSSALAVDMSAISLKCAAMASGVHSDGGRLMPSVSMILITAKEPAPAPMMVRVGASSLRRYSTAGVIASGRISSSACGGSSSSVIRVAAVGEIVLMRMLFLRPSAASTFISPTMPAFAAP